MGKTTELVETLDSGADDTARQTSTLHIDALEASKTNLVAMVFAKTQSAYYKHAVGIASGAARYVEVDVEKTLIHTAIFSGSAEQAGRAIALLRYVESWGTLQLFVRGRLYTRPVSALRNVLECFQEAAHCRDPRGYCLRMSDQPFKRDYGPPPMLVLAAAKQKATPKQLRFFIPCQSLPDRHFLEKELSVPWVDQIHALAVKSGVDWCPFFNLSEFKQFE